MIPTAALPHHVTVEAYQGPSAYGPTYATGVVVRARVTGKRRAVKTSDGVDVIADATVLLRPGINVPAESRVTDQQGRVYTVLGTAVHPGLVRPHHVELILEGPRPSGGV